MSSSSNGKHRDGPESADCFQQVLYAPNAFVALSALKIMMHYLCSAITHQGHWLFEAISHSLIHIHLNRYIIDLIPGGQRSGSASGPEDIQCLVQECKSRLGCHMGLHPDQLKRRYDLSIQATMQLPTHEIIIALTQVFSQLSCSFSTYCILLD